MSGPSNVPAPAPLEVRLEMTSVDAGDGQPPAAGVVFVVVTTPNEERRLWMLAHEVEPYLVAMRSLRDYLQSKPEIPPSMVRDFAGRFQLALMPDELPVEFLPLTQECPRELWFEFDELPGILDGLERHVAAARRAGMLPEVAG